MKKKKKVVRMKKKKAEITVIKNNRLMTCGHPLPSETEMKLEMREMLDDVNLIVARYIEEDLKEDMPIQNQVYYILDALLALGMSEDSLFFLAEDCILEAAERVKAKRENDKKK